MNLIIPDIIKNKFVYTHKKCISGISVVIPFRMNNSDRLNNLNTLLYFLLKQNVSNMEIIISEEDIQQNLKKSDLVYDKNIRIIFTKSYNELFNKSIAINEGVINAKYSSVCMNDCDIIPPNDYLHTMYNHLKSYDSCFLCKDIYNVDFLVNRLEFNGKKRTDYFTGGSIGFTKEAFINIGGMCEKFVGYGSEDCEFWTRVSKLTKIIEKREFSMLHINHVRNNVFSKNEDIYNSILKMDIDSRILCLKKDLEKRLKN